MIYFSTLFLIVSLSATLSYAAPLAGQKRGIDASLLNTFNLMEQYASAAYCASNFDSPGDQIECGSENCPYVQIADSTTVIEYNRQETSTDVTGFVAVDHTNKMIVVSFRGSSDVDNWITNFDFDDTDTDLCSGCTAHHGFWNSWLDARDRVLAAVKDSRTTYTDYAVVVTGHSSGGAVAALAAAQLRNTGYTVALYTFGSPRVASNTLSDYITNQPGGNYRVTHWNDPVPKLPLIIQGYVHISPEYYINKGNKKDVNEGDIKIYEGSVNLKGNSAWLLVDVEAHRWYFKSVYECAASKTKRGILEIGEGGGSVEVFAMF
ncbi:alpha/beta-hydrolase [Dothidotthia symphoricarpi CBS 119687]|uniref:Alpha/beta-hydrolase n=1 Tax=Dothidotthia symphoricarpi CBS 119687 TaxID=1392245 RepID=A0A6A6AL83_9PLEO|nr:alpha/beta-hydrolase [Dothidotthia symphoricarpi CBS 119687]KAF2132326.1 alpha/beta-hydrolase [Dothidotthia symphoricarpi CBS 119687]